MLRGAIVTLALLVAGGAGYVRLAPSDPARWHLAPPADLFQGLQPGQVKPLEGAAVLILPAEDPAALLARLDAVALATPRTRRLAGSPDEGRITWITRSALWGFPDYTTAEATPQGLRLYARLRFGRSDMGVNAARLRDWLARL